MWWAYGLLIVAFISLSACGGGTGKNTGDKAFNQPARETGTDTPEKGSDLFASYRCFTCHSLDGSVMYGPSLNGLYMKEVTVVRQGRELTIVADRDYEKVSGYDRRIMPEPVIPEDDVETLIDYLIGLEEE